MLCSDIMAGVELNLTKGTSGTQCPHLPSDSAPPPSDNGSTALSKSKKKRLRKKKKVETQTAVNSESAELPLTVGKHANITKPPPVVDVQGTKSKKCAPATVVDVGVDKNKEKSPKRYEQIVKPVEDSCAVVPAVLKSKAKKEEPDSKQKKIADVHPVVEKDSKVNHATSPIHQKTVICPAEASCSVMDSSKVARDDVKAQREAKKLAKLAKKNKSGAEGIPLGPVSTDSNTNQPIKNTPQKPKPTTNVQSAQNSSPISSVTTQINEMSLDTIDGEIVKPVRSVGHGAVSAPKTGPVMNDKGSLNAVEKPEKSREEVIAEREAKKLAKLAAKNKKKDGVTEAAKDKTKGDQTAPVEEKAAPKSDGSLVPRVQKAVNDVGNEPSGQEKSKAELKAERRAKQEAQRAAKESSKKVPEKTKPAAGAPAIKSLSLTKENPTQKAQSKPHLSKTAAAKSSSNQPKLLSHLLTDNRPLPSHIYQNVHPAVVELGAKYAARVVSGSNARCIALLQALKRVIVDFVTPREKEFSRAMETRLNDSMAYLNSSRQSSVSMTNALKHVKSHLTQLTTEKKTDDDARKKLCEVIDTFIKEQIDVAGQAISLAVAQKISNGDTIAIYGCSSLLLRILVESHNEGKDFEVVVVDGGPLYEGREMCRRLVSESIKCTYVLLPAFSYIVGQTTKVLLGAHALLANGCVMSRSGTAVVAMLAKAHNVPVIVCCETYKFSERVQADAFVHNELGPQDKVSTPPSISLMYDMTPPTLVDAVATELAILPCTSVPVILRVKPSDVSSYYY